MAEQVVPDPVLYEFELVATRRNSHQMVGEAPRPSTGVEWTAGSDTLLSLGNHTRYNGNSQASLQLLSTDQDSVKTEVAFSDEAVRTYDQFEEQTFIQATTYTNPELTSFNQEIGVRVRVFGKKKPATGYLASLDKADVAFKVGKDGELIKAHKTYLSVVSPVFSAMFNGEFREGDASVVDLTEDESLAIKAFMEAIYPDRVPPNDRNVLALLALDDRYDVNFLLADCEKYLLEGSQMPLIEKFFCAEKYKLKAFQNRLASTIRKEDALEILADPRSKTINPFILAMLRNRF